MLGWLARHGKGSDTQSGQGGRVDCSSSASCSGLRQTCGIRGCRGTARTANQALDARQEGSAHSGRLCAVEKPGQAS